MLVPGVRGRVQDIYWFIAKVAVFMYLYIWYRGTFPRYRFDQLMKVGWKVLLPMGLGVLMLTGIVGLRQRSGISCNTWCTFNMQQAAQPVATTFFFYMLSGLAILSGVLVITRKNAVHSALALIVTLLCVAGLYLMLYAPFVAGVQIILYAGGIMVLFLFVIMLVNLERVGKGKTVQPAMAGRNFGGPWPGDFVRPHLHQGKSIFRASGSTLHRRRQQHAGSWTTSLQQLHVSVRDRVAAAAGSDHGRGGHGEEEDLRRAALSR